MKLSQIDIEHVKNVHDIDSAIAYLYSQIEKTPLLDQALNYSIEAHKTQFRKSGEPYVVHPILVAGIVSSITNDISMAIAALLHDVVEDTPTTATEVSEIFGSDVGHLVQGLTKIDIIRDSELISSSSNERLMTSALSFRKMLIASIEDVRVLVVKLCDRLHNMLTLDALALHKQNRIAEETLVVYAPIAHRLGISYLKNILEDLSFSYLFRQEKELIDQYLEDNFHAIEMRLNDFKESITKILIKNGFCEDDFEILSRVKHRYSVYLKMQRKGIGIDEVLDLLAVRILVSDPVKCYNILGLIHLNFRPLASRFKDYIAIAKDNGYQTIHTSVFFDTAIFEVQIRTSEMHKTAELGVAAHWKYKSGGNSIKLDWLDNLQYQNESAEDFYALMKNDLYSEDISVFSPVGDAFTLPRGAVVLDFAYEVHSEVGNKAVSALVNKTKSSLLTELGNGQAKKAAPSPSLASSLSGIDTGLESFMSADLDDGSLLGDVDKDVVMSEDSVDEAPVAAQRSAMEYPKAAKKMNIKGYVVVNLLINKDGEVEKSKILESEPAGVFDDVVLEGVRGWKFKPGKYKGEAVKVWAKQKVRFDFQ